MPSTTNGIGTTYYGKRDFRTDGSWLTTEWVVVFFIPLLPISSRRIAWRYEEDNRWTTHNNFFENNVDHEDNSRTKNYKILSNEALSFVQISSVYIYCLGFIFLPYLLVEIILPNNFLGTGIFLFILIWSFVPFVLHKIAKMRILKGNY